MSPPARSSRWSRTRYYSGGLEFEPWILNSWIPKHAGIASRDFLEGQIRFGEWKWLDEQAPSFRVETAVVVGSRSVGIYIYGRHHPRGTRKNPHDHVLVYHCHCRRRR